MNDHLEPLYCLKNHSSLLEMVTHLGSFIDLELLKCLMFSLPPCNKIVDRYNLIGNVHLVINLICRT